MKIISVSVLRCTYRISFAIFFLASGSIKVVVTQSLSEYTEAIRAATVHCAIEELNNHRTDNSELE